MITEIKFSLAIFELDPPKGCCEDICRLFLGRNEFNFNSVAFNFLASEVVVYFKMFGFFVENRTVTEFYTALVITIKVSRLVVQNSKFF